MKDLLEQLMQLNEAPVNPGERKGISFKLKKLEKISDKLRQYQNSMSHMQMAQLPGELQKEMQQLQEKLNDEIDKVDKAYQVEFEKSKVDGRPVKMNNLFKALAKNCKEIIKVYKELNKNNFDRQKFLFRGIKSSDDALYGKPFEARKPKDSNRDLHELVNGAINSLGLTANRENAMFVTGDRSQASGYGNSLYILFPLDGFTFTWSRTVKDLILDSNKRRDMFDQEVVKQIRSIAKKAKDENPEDFPISYPGDLFNSGYDYQNDKSKVLSAVEEGKLPDEVKDLLDDLITDKSIQEHFQFTDQDLFGAILSQKEIYIRGDYYAVNTDHDQELFKFLESMDTDNVELPENFGEAPNILDEGDVVKILAGTHQGKLGTITYVYSDKYEVFLTQKLGDTTLSKDEVELYHLPDGSIPVYKRDDKIIVTDDQSRLYGTVGTVYSAYGNGKVEFTDAKGISSTVYKNQLETYTPEREQEIQKDLESRPPAINENDDVVVSDPDSEYYGERGRVNFAYSSGKLEVRLTKNQNYVEFQPNQLVLLKNAPPELLKKTPGEYNLGDTVKITDGAYKGYSGKVTYLYGSKEQAEVTLDGINTQKKVDVPLTALEHVGSASQPDSADSESGIKIGDTVQVINDESSYYGQTGEVIDVSQTSGGTPTVKLKTLFSPYGIKTFASWVEKVDQPKQDKQTFKVNEKFKIKNKDYVTDGTIATVISGPDPDGDYKAVTDDGAKTIYTAPFQMEKIEDAEDAPTFNEGDKVKITDKSSGFYDLIGRIGEGPDDDGDYRVMFDEDDGVEWAYFRLDDMEKVEQPQQTQQTFNVNDTVKLKDTGFSWDGSTATILKGPDSDGDYKVITTVGKILHADAFQMEKIEDSEKTFKVGDTVKIKDGVASINAGKIGKITSVGSSNDVMVRIADGSEYGYFVGELEKVGGDEIDNLNWEPEPEVSAPLKVGDTVKNIKDGHLYFGQTGEVKTVYFTSGNKNVGLVYSDGEQAVDPAAWLEKVQAPAQPATPKFEVNDRVEVVSQFPGLIGMKGKIIQGSPNYDFVSVWLDGNTAASSFPTSALKKITQPEQREEFHLGDMVQVVNDSLISYGQKGKVTDMDLGMLVVQDSESGEVFFAKKANVKKIG
jgi:transcription antitermination factor NusG